VKKLDKVVKRNSKHSEIENWFSWKSSSLLINRYFQKLFIRDCYNKSVHPSHFVSIISLAFLTYIQVIRYTWNMASKVHIKAQITTKLSWNDKDCIKCLVQKALIQHFVTFCVCEVDYLCSCQQIVVSRSCIFASFSASIPDRFPMLLTFAQVHHSSPLKHQFFSC